MLSNINFSLTQLEYVLAVYRYGHFAKAAESCHVTQPTLSMQIQKLEEELGVKIFDRSKKPILLSEVGRKIIEQIQTVLFEAKKIASIIVADQSGAMEGQLTIGVIPTIAPYLLPLLLPVVEKTLPQLELRMFEMQTQRIIEALNADEIDVGILATPLKEPKIIEYPLYYEPFSVLCKKDHELASSRRIKYSLLKFNDIWLLEEGHCLRHQVVDLCSIKQGKNAKRKFLFESGSLETLKNLVDSYGGYTLLPQLATESIGGRSILIPFERPIPAREIGLVYRREHYKNVLIESLGEAILKAIPDDIRKLRQKDLDVLPIKG
jgi:LysR family hydrogen peroxide-inducible transcriptional activator